MARLRRPTESAPTGEKLSDNAESLPHMSFRYPPDKKKDYDLRLHRGTKDDGLLYDGRTLTDDEMAQLASCTEDDFRAAPALAKQIVGELLKVETKFKCEVEAVTVGGYKSRAGELGFRIMKVKRGEYPGRYDIFEHDTHFKFERDDSGNWSQPDPIRGKRVEADLDCDGVQAWVEAKERQREKEREEERRRHGGRGGIFDPFGLIGSDALRRANSLGKLGLDPDATDEDMKIAYRKLARRYHPDHNHDPDAEARFKDITEAYESLTGKRVPHDRFSPNFD